MKQEEARDARRLPTSWCDYLALARESLSVFWWAWDILPPASKRRIRTLMIGLVFVMGANLALPRFVGVIVDGAAAAHGELVVYGLCGIALCLTVSKIADYVFAVAREWVLGMNWGAVDHHITERFFEKSVGQHIMEANTLAVSNIDKGRWKLLDLQGMIFFEGIPGVVSLIFSYIFLTLYFPIAGAIMTIGILGHAAWTLYMNQRVMLVCTPLDAEFRALNRYRVERWEKVERVKTSTRALEEIEHTDERFEAIISKDRTFWIWFIGHAVRRGILPSVCLMTTLAYGAWAALEGEVKVSMLLPLFFWASQLTENLWRIGHIEHQINWNAPSVRSMIKAISIPPDIVSGHVPITPSEPFSIEFVGVGHQYPADECSRSKNTVVLSGVSFKIGPGEKVALLGESGAGKTTVMRLLLRYMDPTEGVIRVQGTDLKDVDLDSWWRAVGYISQQAQILDGTIRDNLTYGLPREERAQLLDEHLWELMRLLKIDFGKRLTDGLDTLVGRNGLKLSGGQAQRLMIGAAAAKHPRFMIIDEATSSLDSTTERAVQYGLASVLQPNIGALVVAHRLSTVRHLCSRFIVLRPTEVMVIGKPQVEAEAETFEELYSLSPTFRQLADDQGLRIEPPDGRVSAHLVSQ